MSGPGFIGPPESCQGACGDCACRDTEPGLDAKLAEFDRHAPAAVGFLIDWLRNHGDDLIALARGRRVWGHYRYENKNFLEYDVPTLLAEASEELADAINYIALREDRLASE